MKVYLFRDYREIYISGTLRKVSRERYEETGITRFWAEATLEEKALLQQLNLALPDEITPKEINVEVQPPVEIAQPAESEPSDETSEEAVEEKPKTKGWGRAARLRKEKA